MASTVLSEYRELHESIYHCKRCAEHGYYAERVQPEWDTSKANRTAIHICKPINNYTIESFSVIMFPPELRRWHGYEKNKACGYTS